MKKYNWGKITINKEEFVSVPNKWNIIKIKNPDYFEIQSSGIDEFEGKKEYLSTESITGTELTTVQETITFKERPARANLQPMQKTVYFAKMKDTFKVILPDEIFCQKYILSTGFAGLNAKGIDSNFLKFIVSSYSFTCKKDGFCMGTTQEAINNRWIREISLPLPPEEEQVIISDHLDETTKKLDIVIENKKRQIELLDESLKIFIFKAVTVGFYQSYKPSRIEFVDKIPTNWKQTKIKYFATVQRGKFTHRPRNDPMLYNGLYPFIQTGDVSQASKYLNNYQQTLNEKGLKVSKMFSKGTLLITIAANIGDVAILNFDSCFPDSIIGINTFSETSNEYLYYLLMSLKQNILKYAKINTQMNINEETIRPVRVPIPPENEQKIILEKINETENVNKLFKENLIREISKLEEYKRIIINDVVTGKVKVTT